MKKSNSSARFTILMFTMSRYSEWQNGIYNRNYFILHELLKRPDVGHIIAIDYLPITPKQKIKVLLTGFGKSKIRKISNSLTICRVSNLGELRTILPKKVNLRKPGSKLIIWSYFPLLIDYFNPSFFNSSSDASLPTLSNGNVLKIFDTVDDWSAHPAYTRYTDQLKDNYKKIAQKADIIFTVSQDLQKNLFKNQKNVFWIPNGVDTTLFQTNTSNQKPKQAKPVIGYIGTIQSRIDFNLVRQVAEYHHDKHFIFVGPVWKDAKINLVKNIQNITFTGRVPYQEIGSYLQKFDIAIIPHKIDQFTRSMNPMKFYEYLAAGLPVISTQAVIKNSALCLVANSPEEFNAAIHVALDENTPERSAERKNFAAQNSWKSRVNDMITIIKEKF